MTSAPPRYREISVHGPPRELGRQIGEAAREELRAFCKIALERVNKTAVVSRTEADDLAASCLQDAEAYNPDLVEELRGMAEAAGLTLDDLMLLQIRNQLTAETEAGCTSLSLAADKTVVGHGLVAQNWDNDPTLDDFTIVLTRHPEGQPSLTTVTQAGLIAYIGFNTAGLGACLNTLPAPSRARGVPHYFTLRDLYQQDCLEDAVSSIQRASRAIPANIILSTPQGPANLEVTIDAIHVLTDSAAGQLTHTNHCLHTDLLPINDDFPELIQSYPRKDRIDGLLNATSDRYGVESIKDALRDHQDHPRSICRHSNDDPETGFWQTVFSVIIEPAARRMHISRGTPCDRPYEIYELS